MSDRGHSQSPLRCTLVPRRGPPPRNFSRIDRCRISLANSSKGCNLAFPISNLLIEALPAQAKADLLKELEPVKLPIGTVLFEADSAPRYAHFMTSGIASLVTVLSEGDGVEVGLVGHEGIPEKTHLLGPQTGMTRCVIQIGGTALRMDFKKLEQKFFQNPALHRLVLRLVQYETHCLAQLTACNRLHEVEERLARWLLMVQDRTGDPEMPLTQEFLAQMLGSRRSTVNLAAGSLQRSGLIVFRRSYIRIENAERLENVACECYPVVHKLLNDLYRNLPMETQSSENGPSVGNVKRASSTFQSR
jgi:CRP-like cAMP-binding protein